MPSWRLGVVRDGIAQYGTARMDGAWHLVVVGVVDWFYLMVVNAGVKPSQSAGTGDWARAVAGVVRDGIAQYWTARMDGALGVVRDGIAQYWDSTDGWGLVLGCGWGG